MCHTCIAQKAAKRIPALVLFSKYNAIRITYGEKPEIQAPLSDAAILFVQEMRHQVSKKEFFLIFWTSGFRRPTGRADRRAAGQPALALPGRAPGLSPVWKDKQWNQGQPVLHEFFFSFF